MCPWDPRKLPEKQGAVHGGKNEEAMRPGKEDGDRWEGVGIHVLQNKHLILKSSKEVPEQELK